jgi:hypothetical protein
MSISHRWFLEDFDVVAFAYTPVHNHVCRQLRYPFFCSYYEYCDIKGMMFITLTYRVYVVLYLQGNLLHHLPPWLKLMTVVIIKNIRSLITKIIS